MAGVLGRPRPQLAADGAVGRIHPAPYQSGYGSKLAMDELTDSTFSCPRCNREVTERFWGPCASCREQLVTRVKGEAHSVEADKFEPAMNVTPNFVATKD